MSRSAGHRPLRFVGRAISFDATGTLLEPRDVAGTYSEVLARHGVEIDRDRVESLFPVVWQELQCSVPAGHDRYALDPEGARGWWRRLVERICALAGTRPPSPFATAELFSRFCEAEAWRVFPEVEATLCLLRDRGYRLAVLSNWDDRLPVVLEAVGLGEVFEVVLTSHEIGRAKPDREIFLAAERALEVEAGDWLHVGDDAIEDAEAAAAAGWNGWLLDRDGGADLASLTDLVVGCPGSARSKASRPRRLDHHHDS